MSTKVRFKIEQSECIFCGACASVAPGHFLIDAERQRAEVARQPESGAEVEACRAAMINCPTSSIAEIAGATREA